MLIKIEGVKVDGTAVVAYVVAKSKRTVEENLMDHGGILYSQTNEDLETELAAMGFNVRSEMMIREEAAVEVGVEEAQEF